MQLPFMIIYSPKKKYAIIWNVYFQILFQLRLAINYRIWTLIIPAEKISTVIFDVNNINRQDKIKV